MKPTAALVLKLINRPAGACPTSFARADLYAYRSRITELRRLGLHIIRVDCERHVHRSGQTKAYVLESGFGTAHATALLRAEHGAWRKTWVAS